MVHELANEVKPPSVAPASAAIAVTYPAFIASRVARGLPQSGMSMSKVRSLKLIYYSFGTCVARAVVSKDLKVVVSFEGSLPCNWRIQLKVQTEVVLRSSPDRDEMSIAR